MANHRYVLSAGHRNYDKGGAWGEYDWTPGATRILAEELRKLGAQVWIVQENDGDNDPTFTNQGLGRIGGIVGSLDRQHGPIDAFLSIHYNGGGSPGFHAIFPDAGGLFSAVKGYTVTDDSKASNPLDVTLARNIAKRVKATNTVNLISWTADSPGVMSERESGVGADGYRISELSESSGIKAHGVRLILEAGSIDTFERGYIQDPSWVRNVYAKAIIAGLRDTFGAFPKEATTGQDESAKPTTPPAMYVLPVKRAWHTDLVTNNKTSVVTGRTRWFNVGRMYRAKSATKRLQYALDDAKEINEPIPADYVFMVDAVGVNHKGDPYALTPWGTMVVLDDLELVPWPTSKS